MIKDSVKEIGYCYHLPVGQALLPLLEQPYISAAILRDLLRARGSFCAAVDKKGLVPVFLLSYLSQSEFDYLMGIVIEREAGRKVRNDYDEVAADTALTLGSSLPNNNEFDLAKSFKYEDSHFKINGSPSLERLSENHYRLDYSVNRKNLHSNWLKSEQQFSGTVDIIKDDLKEIVKFEAFHTSDETRSVNRFITKQIRKKLTEEGLIKNNSTRTIRFNSFTNEQRIEFLMKYTGAFDGEVFKFDRLIDLSLRADEDSTTKDDRISWMKKKVSKLNVSGTELQDTFFVTDKTCRPHLLFWRFECRYTFKTADGDGSIIVACEFGGYSKLASSNAPFHVTCIRFSGSKYKGGHKSFVRELISRLNSYQIEFADAVLSQNK